MRGSLDNPVRSLTDGYARLCAPWTMAAWLPLVGLAMAGERTFIAIKPDGVQRGLVADILGRFERKGFNLVGLKLLTPSRALAE